MRLLIFGAGSLGSLYSHLFHQAVVEVTLLASGARYNWLKENSLVLVDEMSGEEERNSVYSYWSYTYKELSA